VTSPAATQQQDVDAHLSALTGAGACGQMQNVLNIVGRRWAGAILFASASGARRFGEYRRLIAGISDRLLSQRLRELEALQLIEREVIPTTPVQILYKLTPTGEQLVVSLHPLLSWGVRYLSEIGTEGLTSIS
jgi:DNA-binding HxlR family transcriptional regulator